MKRRILASGLALFSAAVVVALGTENSLSVSLSSQQVNLGIALGSVTFSAALLTLLTSFESGRPPTLMRLDWFTPFLRRQKDGQPISYSVTGKLLRRILPSQFQSNRSTKKRGFVRRTLRRLGITWLASPVRRVTQATCLVIFFILFFYVCWPYSAQPDPPGRMSSGWNFAEVEQESGDIKLRGEFVDDWTPNTTDTLFLFDESVTRLEQAAAGEFQVQSVTSSTIDLQPVGEFEADVFDQFFASPGPWTFHETDPTAWPSHYTDDLASKELIPAESFLLIDPLVSLSTAVATRSWIWSLVFAAAILIVCLLIPRGFCGYLCPLGTTIDLFDWAIGRRVKRFQVSGEGWWVHLKYYLLAGTLTCSVFGVLVSGFFSAIPIITRGMLFLFEPLQTGSLRGWYLIAPMNAGHFISLLLFLTVLSLGFLRPRFWCKYVCPSGALFSLGNLFRVTERQVESSCINCNKCIEICPFDAIKPDFTTRTTDCTLCQSCGGVCPTHAIKFVDRWNNNDLKVLNDPPTHETAIGRRGFLSLACGSAAAVVGGVGLATATKSFGANLDDKKSFRPVRPPGSLPESNFLEACIRCGECFKVCPNNVLQAEGFQQGLEGLWTPLVNADWAGCESSCNACGQVCPTGAIRALPLEEKQVARMGLAIVNTKTCLPFAQTEACDLCVQECNAAGYNAIEYIQVGTQVDDEGIPIENTGYAAPVVLRDKCVGCGLCQTRCNAINVKEKHLLKESAIVIEAGKDYEDRLTKGSYIELRKRRRARLRGFQPDEEFFIPDADLETSPELDLNSLPEGNPFTESDDDPFGIEEK